MVEQLLTTGGGWQDQVGCLYPGVKKGFITEDDSSVDVEEIPISQDFEAEINKRMGLIYTAKTRLAKNLLQEVIRGWYSGGPIRKVITSLEENVSKFAKALKGGEMPCDLIDVYYHAKKTLATGCEPDIVASLISSLKGANLIETAWLAGAGGGGFLYVWLKPDITMDQIRDHVKKHGTAEMTRPFEKISRAQLELSCWSYSRSAQTKRKRTGKFFWMDRLNSAIDTLVDEICSGLSKPKYVRAAARDTGVKLSREDAAEIVTKLLAVFRAKFAQGVEELVQDSEIEQKLADLKILAEKCKERNEQLGITDGYRPLGSSREKLKKAKDQVNTLAKMADSLMNKNQKPRISLAIRYNKAFFASQEMKKQGFRKCRAPPFAFLSNRINGNNTVTAATCRDNDLARFMNNAMSAYIHDMGGLSRNILDQITAYRKPGTWLVHAEIISGRAQGREWQTLTNGDVFSGRSLYGCYYHDMQTYVLVLRLY
ncbi:GHMP kinase protein [Ancylostoma ceylanicum]|uniref:GHMP kinase protein n=1 Tax=Ancylostoma ceylanicum TaxID=53326 RepID=A0A0D6LKE6_9BILA|nr:GHMP kinase protein [Ancylostoma ceylanicum]